MTCPCAQKLITNPPDATTFCAHAPVWQTAPVARHGIGPRTRQSRDAAGERAATAFWFGWYAQFLETVIIK